MLRTLLESERLGVLSTHHAGAPYASLVAFVAWAERHLVRLVQAFRAQSRPIPPHC